ncbi:hypothetical protein [uncultured Roseobacter sp.]|uniref:hypothetical protein n=1 Tax=uncultured Roseobacter sp. TaxID=114847 RepID=UPI002638615A|nr:hypothetical protein [uncultured Roseobacter sp.]
MTNTVEIPIPGTWECSKTGVFGTLKIQVGGVNTNLKMTITTGDGSRHFVQQNKISRIL